MNARIIKIDDSRALVGLLDDKGECGTGGCGGCKCSTGLKTMQIDLPDGEEWREGDVLSLRSRGAALDGLVLIVLPLSAAAALSFSGVRTSLSLLSGGLLFGLCALCLRLFRGKSGLKIDRL